MPEYIEREALCEYFQKKFEYYKAESEKKVCGGYVFDEKMQYAAIVAKHFLDTAKEAPAADVAEVVHGEWKTEQNTGGYEVCMRCSVCGFQFDNWKHIFSYCPECGAKMDGKDGRII